MRQGAWREGRAWGCRGALGSPANCIKLLSVQFIASSARVSTFSYATAEVVCVWSICESLELVLLSFTLFVLFTSYYFFFSFLHIFEPMGAPSNMRHFSVGSQFKFSCLCFGSPLQTFPLKCPGMWSLNDAPFLGPDPPDRRDIAHSTRY